MIKSSSKHTFIVLGPSILVPQFVLTQVTDNAGPDGVSQDVGGGPEPVQQPVHGEDHGDEVAGETHGVQDHHHGHQTSLGDSSGSNAGAGGGDGDGEDLTNGGVHVLHLSYEDGRHRLVESRPVHVDGGSNGENEPGDPRVDAVLLFQTVHGDGERSRAGGGAPSRHDGLTLVSNEPEDSISVQTETMTVGLLPEWQFPTGDGVDERQDQQPVDAEAEHHHEEVPAQLLELGANIFHLEELAGHQEADSNGSEVDDPGRDLHHDDAAALEELQQRFAVLSTHGYGDAQDDTEDNQAQLGEGLDEKLTTK